MTDEDVSNIEFVNRTAAGFDAATPKIKSTAPIASLTSLLAPAIPQPPVTVSDRKLSAVIQGHYAAFQTADKSWIVHVPATGCVVTSAASSAGALSSALNIPGDQTADVHGNNVTFPLSVVPGDALILMSARVGTPSPLYPDQPVSSAIDEAMAIVFVPYPVGPGMFRPPAIGRRTNPTVYFLRTYEPILYTRVDLSKLPRLFSLDDLYQIPGFPRPGDADRIDPTQTDAARPTWASTVLPFGGETIGEEVTCAGRFAGDWYGEWRVADRCPYTQHAGYGSNYAGTISTYMMMAALTNEPQFEKNRELATHCIIQRGLDDVGRLADNCFLKPDGGHMRGRRALVTFAGIMLNSPEIADYTKSLGERTPEDNGFPYGNWWFNDPEWTVLWPNQLNEIAHFPNHPSTWGDPTVHGTLAWAFSYNDQKIPASTGAAAVIQLMKGERYAPKWIQSVRQYQKRPSAAVQALFISLNFSPNLFVQRDFKGPKGFAALVWHRFVRQLPGLPPP